MPLGGRKPSRFEAFNCAIPQVLNKECRGRNVDGNAERWDRWRALQCHQGGGTGRWEAAERQSATQCSQLKSALESEHTYVAWPIAPSSQPPSQSSSQPVTSKCTQLQCPLRVTMKRALALGRGSLQWPLQNGEEDSRFGFNGRIEASESYHVSPSKFSRFKVEISLRKSKICQKKKIIIFLIKDSGSWRPDL